MFKRVMSYALASLLSLMPFNSGCSKPVVPRQGNVSVYIHTFNPKKYDIRIASAAKLFANDKNAKSYDCCGRTLEQIVDKYECDTTENVVAAINASYFCPGTYELIGREVIDSKLMKTNPVKRAVSHAKYEKPRFEDYDFKFRASFVVDKFGAPKIGYFNDVSGAKYFLTAGPLLIQEGKDVWLDSYRKEKFDDYYKRPYRRSAVGIAANGDIVLVASNEITLDTLVQFMLKRGVKNAMCLDSGSSVQLIGDSENGNYLIYGTKRRIANGIIVVEK
jgi:exopolysaccharide biosynthesis protein